MRFLKCATLCLGLSSLMAFAYIVKEGDTLWDLSDEYLKDPFAWPDLWENNRHIQDPHWIYPGDSIYLGDSLRDEPMLYVENQKSYPCNAALADSNLPKGVKAVGCDENDGRGGDFENMLGDLRSRDKKQKPVKQQDAYFYQKRPEPKIFNGYYQYLAPLVYEIDSLKNDSSFVSIRSGEKKQPLIHLPENEVVVGIGKQKNANLKLGDLVEIFDAKIIEVPTQEGSSFEKYALLRVNGIARITAIGDTLSRAQIVQSFKEIRINQAKARLKQPLQSLNVTGYTKLESTSIEDMATIVYAMDPSLIIGAYAYVLINKGVSENFNTGDAVAIWEEDNSDPSIPPRLLGRGIITRSAPNESAVLIRELYSANRRVEIGHKVSITHSANIKK